jgi:WD40 repeat protein
LRKFVHSEDIYSSVNFVDMSSDGRLVLTASNDGTIRVWDRDTGSLMHILTGHSDRVTAAVFARNNGQVLSTSNDGTLRMWDTATGALLKSFRGHLRVGPNRVATITSLYLSKDGKTVVTGGIDDTVRIWEMPDRISNENELVAKACRETLRGSPSADGPVGLSVLTAAERKVAPAISPTDDYLTEGDVCTAIPLWRRLSNLLMIGR